MKPSPPARLSPLIESALQRLRMVARGAAERTVETLGTAAAASNKIFQRDRLIEAQYQLSHKLPIFVVAFDDAFDRLVRPPSGQTTPGGAPVTEPDWNNLSLVDDRELDARVLANRFALEIAIACEWEVRELDSYVGALQRMGHAVPEPNPMRPDGIGEALMRAIDSVAERPDVRKLIGTELARNLSGMLKQTYLDIIDDFRHAGVSPLGLTVRVAPSPFPPPQSFEAMADSEPIPAIFQTYGAQQAFHQAPFGGADDTAPAPAPRQATGTLIGRVDEQVMAMIRRLVWSPDALLPDPPSTIPSAQPAANGSRQPMARTADGSGGPRRAAPRDAAAQGAAGHAPDEDDDRPPTNIIAAHRNALRQAARGAVDHRVIDIVGALFDQILVDPKVAPQMARLIARLQLPVLRAALGDPSFFSSRDHPVRRFVNRIASLACAYDDFNDTGAAAFLELVGELVGEVVGGDFDRIEVYEQKIGVLESFIRGQTLRVLQARGNADELLARKEIEAERGRDHARQLESALNPIAMPDFIRQFVAHVWSRALLTAALAEPPQAAAFERLARAGRNLIMSVQSKGSPAQRKAFLMQLPELMRDLNAGMDLIALPDIERKSFFARLLPAHAESLKGVGLKTLDYNLLAHELDAIFNAPIPEASAMSIGSRAASPIEAAELPQQARFSADEARGLGLVDEGLLAGAAAIDIDLSAEPEISAVDIAIDLDGVPAPDPVAPSRGRSLADNLQLGQAYWMNVADGWHKVRLVHASPGQTFFVFTRGPHRHQSTITVSARVLIRLCDDGRFRAFEVAGLIERATARARQQGFEPRFADMAG